MSEPPTDLSAPDRAIASSGADKPVLRVIRGGRPDATELAALVAVIAARSEATPDEPAPLRRRLSPWVASGLIKGTRTHA